MFFLDKKTGRHVIRERDKHRRLWRLAVASYVYLVCCNSKFKTPYSDALPSDTIFAFLMLKTMSPTHEEIFGVKFLSFERL